MLVALLLLVVPGAIVGRTAQLTWPVAVAVGPALTYGVVALAILPMGAIGVPWNGWTALVVLLLVVAVVASLQAVFVRRRDGAADGRPISMGPALVVAAGVVLGAAADRLLGNSRDAALAIDPEHLGRRLARQHRPIHPGDRPGLTDPHG